MATSLYLFTALQLTSLVRTHTKILVPRVLTWSSDASNRTGTEYIIMEKAMGVQLVTYHGLMGLIEMIPIHMTSVHVSTSLLPQEATSQ